ncbi:MAG: cupin domain-containing protein [Ruminococcaceae bacterium]|nr:cupin domain-containing protein [Oscillospiraceae bacterium]
MYKRSENCPMKDICVQNGNGLTHIKELSDRAAMYDHARMFAHVTLEPGRSIGYHIHEKETEFYYILKGEGVFNDNGTEVIVRPGDICATAHGEHHGMENRSAENLEMIALIVLDN